MVDIHRRSKLPGPNGQLSDAELIDVTESKEPWSEYSLDDGTIVRVKNILLEVWRFVDQYDQQGNPVYMVKGNPMISVIAPQQLKKK